MNNFTYWSQHLMEQIMLGYHTALGLFVWPLIFCGVIGYIYLKQQSYVAAAAATLVILSVFVNYMAGMETFISILFVLSSLAITGLFLIFLSKRRG